MFSCTKRKKVDDYYESIGDFSIHDEVDQPKNSFETIFHPQSSVDYNEGIMIEREIPSDHQLEDSFETILYIQSNIDYNEGATIEHEISLIHQYCHQLLKESRLWYLDEDNVHIMTDYKLIEVTLLQEINAPWN